MDKKPPEMTEEAQQEFDNFLDKLKKESRRVKIVRNSAKCLKCGDEIESTHRHDFNCCSCGSLCVDGGKDYLRRCGNFEDYEDTSIHTEVDEAVQDKLDEKQNRRA